MRLKTFLTPLLLGILFILLLAIPALGFGYENPADLAFSDTQFELVLPQLKVGMFNNLFNLNNINADLTDPLAKQAFLDRLEDGVLRLNVNTGLETDLNFGKLVFRLRPWMVTTTCLDSGLVNLIFQGYEPNRTYALGNTFVNGLAAISLDSSFGRVLLVDDNYSVGIGGTLHIINGAACYNAEMVNSQVVTDSYGQAVYNAQVRYFDGSNGFSSDASGFGLMGDLGVTFIFEDFNLGMVIKNLGTGINWRGLSFSEATYSGEIQGTEDGTPEIVNPVEVISDPVSIDYNSQIPAVIAVQGEFQLIPDELTATCGIEKGFKDGWGVSSTPRFWGGLDWRPVKLIRLAGEVSLLGKNFQINTLSQLRMGFLWLTMELNQTGGFLSEDITGIDGTLSLALHF